ncbi:hypothetical protein [Methylorubrum suomiense]|uniref:Uncharacterized protein n=1 Tax=Methylorubrum suomiense TaxID=144191 RepID=A0ABQ4V6G3_9HYPH|nr:hypothetical protein [Methylorubrum suomiense]GJE78112.1 hypothetical protein BGCPKDLD_4723 [Methylorubrum suomiense]
MSQIQRLIDECRTLKQGDTEFILSSHNDGYWDAGIGNDTGAALGEASPQFSGSGSTPEAAVVALLANLKAAGGVVPDTRSPFDKMIADLTDDELRHWNGCWVEAFPGEIVGGFIRSSWIVAATVMNPTKVITGDSIR